MLSGSVARVTKAAAETSAAPRIERLIRELRIEGAGTRLLASYRYDARAFVEDVLRAEQALGITSAR